MGPASVGRRPRPGTDRLHRGAPHPVQAASADPVVRQSTFDSAHGSFIVPARTVAVFVETA
ncbi:alpha-1,6-glucosidase domain-containing protein [Dactylosporangium roseum]|uniref:alpha-1,6-glucosidase domain-containing protein n=1 Tax=Dactylosporangium roseum TaxID=47989 RepID=UPI0036F38785